MGSSAKAIVAQLVTQIQGANGSGVYTHDLSSRTYRGVPKTMIVDSNAEAWVCIVREDSVTGASFRHHTRRLAIRVFGVSGTFGDSYSTREDAVLDLANDIMRAVESDRSLGGRVNDITGPSMELVEGGNLANRYDLAIDDVEALEGVPVVVVELVAEYYMTTGV